MAVMRAARGFRIRGGSTGNHCQQWNDAVDQHIRQSVFEFELRWLEYHRSGRVELLPTLSPFGLDLSVLATCTSGACLSSPLAVYYTVQNYTATVPAGGLQETFSTAQTGASAASATSWADSTNALYAGSEPAGNLIGTVGTFSAPGGIGTVDGGSSQTSSTPYSLTLEELFNADGAIASFSANGNITSAPSPVPVPPSLALLGSGLLAAILLGRRSRTFRV